MTNVRCDSNSWTVTFSKVSKRSDPPRGKLAGANAQTAGFLGVSADFLSRVSLQDCFVRRRQRSALCRRGEVVDSLVEQRRIDAAPVGDAHRAAARALRTSDLRVLELNAGQWRTRRDFYDALSAVLGGIERDCRSSESLLETMVFHLDRNTEQPPYEVVIRNPPEDLRSYLSDFAHSVEEARRGRSAKWGDDVEVIVTVD